MLCKVCLQKDKEIKRKNYTFWRQRNGKQKKFNRLLRKVCLSLQYQVIRLSGQMVYTIWLSGNTAVG